MDTIDCVRQSLRMGIAALARVGRQYLKSAQLGDLFFASRGLTKLGHCLTSTNTVCLPQTLNNLPTSMKTTGARFLVLTAC